MSELKITIDQLKNYLGTGMKVEYVNVIHNLKIPLVVNNHTSSLLNGTDINAVIATGCKPICYRLSDLDKEIEVNGERFVPLRWFEKEGWFGNDLLRGMVRNKYINTETLPFCIIKKLFDWHFWIFGDEYFGQGLVIDKMTVK